MQLLVEYGPPTSVVEEVDLRIDPVGHLGDYSLVELVLGLAQVRYDRRGQSRSRLPSTYLARRERDLMGELRRRGVVFSDSPLPGTAVDFRGLF